MRTKIYRNYAFLARYGHQPLTILRQMTTRDLSLFGQELAAVLNEERKQFAANFGSMND